MEKTDKRTRQMPTAADGATAVGMETPFSDEFVLWANASEQLRSHAEDLMRQIMGGAQS